MMNRKTSATIEEIMSLYSGGIIGKIETRNWLALEYPKFKLSRRKDVDDFLENYGTSILDSTEPTTEEIEPDGTN